jgi:hypothetical protein
LTVRLHRRGVIERAESRGLDVGASESVAMAGQLVVSKIDARNGAIGFVPEELDGSLVSSDFLLFDIHGGFDRDYLDLYFSTARFRRECERFSKGSTNRRRISSKRFLQIELPVPTDIDQQRAVARDLRRRLEIVEAAGTRAAAASSTGSGLYASGLRNLIQGARVQPGDEGAEALRVRFRSAYEKAGRNASPGVLKESLDAEPFELPSGFEWVELGAAITLLVDCVHATPSFSERPTDFIGLKTTNVRPNELVLDERWYMDRDSWKRWTAPATPRAGDLVLTREAPMGYVCEVPSTPAVCLTQRMVLIRTDDRFVSPAYLRHVMNEAAFMQQAKKRSRSAPPHLNVKDIPRIWIPLCGLQTQRTLVTRFEELWATTKRLGSAMARREKELNALRLSLINEAFSR